MPFASTMPRLTPIPKRMTVRAKKPKKVTEALDSSMVKLRCMQWAMASTGSSNVRCMERKRCRNTIA